MTLTLGHVTTVTARGGRAWVSCCCGWASPERTDRAGRWPDQPPASAAELLVIMERVAKTHRDLRGAPAPLPAQRARTQTRQRKSSAQTG